MIDNECSFKEDTSFEKRKKVLYIYIYIYIAVSTNDPNQYLISVYFFFVK